MDLKALWSSCIMHVLGATPFLNTHHSFAPQLGLSDLIFFLQRRQTLRSYDPSRTLCNSKLSSSQLSVFFVRVRTFLCGCIGVVFMFCPVAPFPSAGSSSTSSYLFSVLASSIPGDIFGFVGLSRYPFCDPFCVNTTTFRHLSLLAFDLQIYRMKLTGNLNVTPRLHNIMH